MLKILEEEADKANFEIKRINLIEEVIEPFDGKLEVKRKTFAPLYQNFIDCDGFVIATPTYWFNSPGVLKNFIDNLTPLEENGWLLERKVAGVIVYAPQGGGTEILGNLSLTFNHMGVTIPPYGLIYFRDDKDEWALADIKLLVKSFAQQLQAQRERKFTW